MRALLLFLMLGSMAFGQMLPQTTAERSQYTETSRVAAEQEFLQALAKTAPNVLISEYGKSTEGRSLPVMILSEPPIKNVADVGKQSKPVVLVFANIHAGEVDGKEALYAMARDLSQPAGKELLKKVTVVLAPNINPDGNEKVDPKSRTEQNGPKLVGSRENAAGLDLNRDFIKLESVEIRQLLRLIQTTNPAVVIDCHTTNGS
ncbi:MAG: M14 family zinc carboxypeptidase, partial [Gemmataceae bacterium]